MNNATNPDESFPVIDESRCSVHLNGREYFIGRKYRGRCSNQFWLFVFLLEVRGRQVTYLEVGQRVQKDFSVMSDEAIHKMVSRLKMCLPDELAQCIVNGNDHIQLIFPKR